MKTATSTTVTDKIKDRLEELDQFEEETNMQEMINLSQQDYAKRIEDLNKELLQAWNEDERVKSLKIVIQVLSCQILVVIVLFLLLLCLEIFFRQSVQNSWLTQVSFNFTQASLF